MNKEEIKVLFVDDDTLLGDMVSQGLMYLGYKVHYQSTMIALGSIINEFRPNVIILDVEIGDKDGIDDSAGVRLLFPNIPIIFVSSHIESSYVIRALDSGGATYIKKPIDIEELAAYINRYAVAELKNTVGIGHFTLDTSSRLLFDAKNKNSYTLNKKECELLYLLIDNKECVISRSTIIKEVWNNDFSSDQVLNNYVSKLRKNLAGDSSISIETVPREGYRLICKIV